MKRWSRPFPIVLVPVFEGCPSESSLALAGLLDTSVRLLGLVQVNQGSPFSGGSAAARELRKVLRKYTAQRNLEQHFQVSVSFNAWQDLHEHIHAVKPDLVILDWEALDNCQGADRSDSRAYRGQPGGGARSRWREDRPLARPTARRPACSACVAPGDGAAHASNIRRAPPIRTRGIRGTPGALPRAGAHPALPAGSELRTAHGGGSAQRDSHDGRSSRCIDHRHHRALAGQRHELDRWQVVCSSPTPAR